MGSTRDTLKRRVRKTIKWGGAGLTVLLVVVWIGSGWRAVSWFWPDSGVVGLQAGCLTYHNVAGGGKAGDYLNFWFRPENKPFKWGFSRGTRYVADAFAIPLWFPALLSLLATAAAWRADAKYLRRVREGACPGCGYDRAGLAVGAVCPECGAAAGA